MSPLSRLSVQPGSHVTCDGARYEVQRAIDLDTVLARHVDTGQTRCLRIANLAPVLGSSGQQTEFDLTAPLEHQWLEARRRREIIQPIIDRGFLEGGLCAALQREHRVSRSSLFRWFRQWKNVGTVSALRRAPNSTRGTQRLEPSVEAIVQQTIDDVYHTKQQYSMTATIGEVRRRCRRAGVPAPSDATVRRRIALRGSEANLRKRAHRKEARDNYEPRTGVFAEATYPLAVVQIDHALLDVECVDGTTRESLGRPWLTLAIDVYSRVIFGYYLGYEGPSVASTGMCISTGILRKEGLLERFGVRAHWPVWGVPRVLHSDNGKDFHARSFLRACEEYGIVSQFRPVKRPVYGGHIERLFGSLENYVHELPGSTFSNPKQKGEYKPSHEASLTLEELECWFLNLVCHYHNQPHGGIGGATPLQRYEAGMLDTDTGLGCGLPDVYADEHKVRFDFMPAEERIITRTGVQIHHIRYFHDSLRPYIQSEPAKHRPLHLFRYDPRDISAIYFYDTRSESIVRIPYANIARPRMTAWELQRIMKAFNDRKITIESEDQIFDALNAMRAVAFKAKATTRQTRRQNAKTGSIRQIVKAEEKQYAILEEMGQSTIAEPFDVAFQWR